MKALELIEKYNNYNTKVIKIKKIQMALKGNKELDDSIDVLKELLKESVDKSNKIKEILENINIEVTDI